MHPEGVRIPTDPNNAGASQNPAGAEDARIAATIANWKRKLLDISKRNRALNFKPTKVSTVAIIDEHPAEAFRHLYIQGRQMRFRPAQAKVAPEPAAATLPYDQIEEEVEEFNPAPDFVPYDAAGLVERHTDDILQTSLPSEDLDRSLRRISDQARVSIEEQGVNTLFLAQTFRVPPRVTCSLSR